MLCMLWTTGPGVCCEPGNQIVNYNPIANLPKAMAYIVHPILHISTASVIVHSEGTWREKMVIID